MAGEQAVGKVEFTVELDVETGEVRRVTFGAVEFDGTFDVRGYGLDDYLDGVARGAAELAVQGRSDA